MTPERTAEYYQGREAEYRRREAEYRRRAAELEKPMDQKPLRQEDYVAMAEENRRMKKKLADLEAPKKSQVPDHGGASVALKTFLSLLALAMTITLVSWGLVKRHDKDRKTACYFVAQTKGGPYPWDPWYVWRSDCSWCANEAVTSESKRIFFKSKAEAWNFILSWKLEPCR